MSLKIFQNNQLTYFIHEFHGFEKIPKQSIKLRYKSPNF